jgi:hypothetical protein
MEESTNKIINVYALFRDSEKHIKRTLEQFSNLTVLPNLEFNFFFYANDCKDNTTSILEDWCCLHGGKVLYEELNAPKFGSVVSEIRTALLAYYRNKNKELGAKTPSDYSLVIDSDLTWGNSDFNALLDFMEENQNYVMATSNCRQNVPDLVFGETTDSYYDIYCFRDKVNLGGVYFADSPFYRKEDKEKFQNLLPVEVNSAFGGLALIDSRAFNEEKWTSFGESEHVAFCGELKSWGKIAVIPTSKPFSEIDLTTLNMENCKNIGLQQKEKWLFINQLNSLSKDSEYKFSFTKKT